MSDSGFNTSVLGATAYQKRFGSLARNLAASNAVAGRGEETFITSFQLNSGRLSGVDTTTRRFLHEVGIPIESHIDTHFSITGNGFALVKGATNSNKINFVRDCTFDADKNGNLVNNGGQYLQGFLTDPLGKFLSPNTSVQGLKTINIKNLRLDPTATTNISTNLNLSVNDQTLSYPTTIYTPFGTQETLTFNWTKAPTDTIFSNSEAQQGWILTLEASNSAVGSPYNTGVRVEMDAQGNPLTYVDLASSSNTATSPFAIPVTWTNPFTGATAITSAITLDLPNSMLSTGTGVSQGYADSDGYTSGLFQRIAFDEQGYGMVTYSNQQTRPYCRLPLATFNNIDGLKEVQAGVFQDSTESGPYILGFPNTDSFGALQGGYYEGSTTDASKDYLNMIANQKDYMMNLKSIEVAKAMLTKLENI